jgi:putative chitinase
VRALDADLLRDVMPGIAPAAAESWAPVLVAVAAEFDITPPRRLAAFLAQAAVESAELALLSENLNYSAEGLLKTWPSRFTTARAAALARRPVEIANHVYADREGNGPRESGDGWRFRGRGIFQLTFRNNYAAAGAALGLPLVEHPELVAEDRSAAARTAGWFWSNRGLSALADAGDFRELTRRINRGLLHFDRRRQYHLRACRALGLEAS